MSVALLSRPCQCSCLLMKTRLSADSPQSLHLHSVPNCHLASTLQKCTIYVLSQPLFLLASWQWVTAWCQYNYELKCILGHWNPKVVLGYKVIIWIILSNIFQIITQVKTQFKNSWRGHSHPKNIEFRDLNLRNSNLDKWFTFKWLRFSSHWWPRASQC